MLLESVPNISEGRDTDLVREWADWWRGREGVALLDHSSDADHHRSVFTLAGAERPLVDGLVEWAHEPLRSIDLTRHQGAHPRIGAVDVVPLVPLADATRADAARAALTLAERFGCELRQPVYLYAQSATHGDRRRLADLRRGGLDALSRRAAESPLWQSDFGPREIDPRSGVTAVGARDLLVAVNAILASEDEDIARQIARSIRESNGGIPGVQAIGLYLESRTRAQVSMNLTDIHRSPVPRVMAEVERLAAASSVGVEEVELIGLVPRAALAGAAPGAFGWGERQVLEVRLEEEGLGARDWGQGS